MSESLTVFLTIPDPLSDESEDAIEDALGVLDSRIAGIGEVVGSDASADEVQLHVLAYEPERVIPLLIETLHALGAQPPSKLVASDPASGATLYERSLT